VTVFLLLFVALGSLYYYKERNRLFQEQKLEYRLEFSECQRVQKLLENSDSCEMRVIEEIDGIDAVLKDIGIVFILVFLAVLPVAYALAMMSLRPMKEAIDTIDSFVNGIVHDINTPLSVIKLNAQSMNTQLDSERLRDKNSRILQGISDIESLEEQLIFSLKADRYQLNRILFDLSDLIKQRSKYWNEIRSSVAVRIDVQSLHVKADEALLIRMIDNIVLNAIKFSSRDQEVVVTLSGTKLSICDHGCGIKDPDNVFQKYYRENRKTKGLGLGLFVVKSIADMHKITIKVDSEIDVGTEFILELKSIGALNESS
jgi:two-component system OmpR family sensor kinase